MSRFQILCVTMNQHDFSKINKMNIKSDVIFANQAAGTSYEELKFNNHTAKMITTDTRGVGINRNIALSYADADVCLLADDDITYYDRLEEKVLAEFDSHPDADVIIFHLDTDVKERELVRYKETRKVRKFDRKPWGAVRVAFKLSSVRRANVWFSTLFGGGAKYPCGEDSIWIEETFHKGLVYYVSNQTIGFVSCMQSSWFTGYDEKRFFASGALYSAIHPHTVWIWIIYFACRTSRLTMLPFYKRIKWEIKGVNAYFEGLSYEDYRNDE